MDSTEENASLQSLKRDEETAIAVLRAGAAVNAIRSAQCFTLYSTSSDGPARQRDQFWAFLTAAGYVASAIDMLRKTPTDWCRLRCLALKHGAEPTDVGEVAQLIDQTHQRYKQIFHVRDKVTFHWDRQPFRTWLTRQQGPSVTWAVHGSKNVDTVFTASVNAVASQMLGLADDSTYADFEREFTAFVSWLPSLMRCLLTVLEHAIAEHFQRYPPTA